MDPKDIENEILGADTTDTEGEGQDLRGEGGEETRETSSARDFDAEASRKGWVPKDHYRGDPSKWVDAKTFVERGERFNKNLQRELEAVKAELASFKGTAAKFAKFHEETVARKNEEIKEAISALRVQRAEALRDGDAGLSVELEDKIDHLKEQQANFKKETEEAKPEAQQPPGRDLVLEEWIEDGNAWFKSEPKMQQYAVEIGKELRDSGVPVNGREFLDKVTERMHRDFPRYFRQKTSSTARGAVDDGGSRDGNSGSRSGSYSERDLPEDDRQLMKELVQMGATTKERFLAGYFSDGPRKHQTKSSK